MVCKLLGGPSSLPDSLFPFTALPLSLNFCSLSFVSFSFRILFFTFPSILPPPPQIKLENHGRAVGSPARPSESANKNTASENNIYTTTAVRSYQMRVCKQHDNDKMFISDNDRRITKQHETAITTSNTRTKMYADHVVCCHLPR